MKLQDIITTNRRMDVAMINNDDELSRQIQNILIKLNLLNPPADGVFGPLSTGALHRFQTITNCGEPGFIGRVSADKLLTTTPQNLPVSPIILKVIQNTVLKSKPIQSTLLTDNEKQLLEAGKELELVVYNPVRNHLRVALRNQSFKNSSIWYIFKPHAEIYQNQRRVFPRNIPARMQLKNFPYKSQLDNWYNPTGSCNVTSMAMCMEYLSTPRRSNSGQFEDELYVYALNQGYSRWDPYDLARIVRDYGCRDYFTETATIEEVKEWLADGKPAVIHGYFTTFGHIMPVVGYDESGFLVHDPYGEWFPGGYRTDLSGAYLHYSYNLIRRTCIPDGNFWVHFISN